MDPVVIGTSIVVISDAYTRFLDSLLDQTGEKLDGIYDGIVSLKKEAEAANAALSEIEGTLEDGFNAIESQILQQNRAHYKAAELALEAGDIGQSINSLRLALANDNNRFNPVGWSLYACLLAKSGNHEHALEVFQRVIDTYGPECPALPAEIRENISIDDPIYVSSKTPISLTIKDAARPDIIVTKAGVLYHQTCRHMGTTSLLLARWDESILTVQHNMDFSFPFYTDEYLVHQNVLASKESGEHTFERVSLATSLEENSPNGTSSLPRMVIESSAEEEDLHGMPPPVHLFGPNSGDNAKPNKRGANVDVEFIKGRPSEYYNSPDTYRIKVQPLTAQPVARKTVSLPPSISKTIADLQRDRKRA